MKSPNHWAAFSRSAVGPRGCEFEWAGLALASHLTSKGYRSNMKEEKRGNEPRARQKWASPSQRVSSKFSLVFIMCVRLVMHSLMRRLPPQAVLLLGTVCVVWMGVKLGCRVNSSLVRFGTLQKGKWRSECVSYFIFMELETLLTAKQSAGENDKTTTTIKSVCLVVTLTGC